MTLLRSFIALYPDAAALQAMTACVDCLRSRESAVRWSKPSQLHITLKFLGDVTREQLTEVEEGLRRETAGHAVIGDRIAGIGGFPSLTRPRVIWLGVDDADGRIGALNSVVEEVCGRAGLEPEEKGFTPHFTLGRVRQQGGTAHLEKALSACSFDSTPVSFSTVRIMQSVLTPRGAIHTVVADIPLRPGE